MKSSTSIFRFVGIGALGILCSACEPAMDGAWQEPPPVYQNQAPVVYQHQYGNMAGMPYGGMGRRESQVDRIVRENEAWKARQNQGQTVATIPSSAPGAGVGYDFLGGIVTNGMNKTHEQIDAETRKMNGINRLSGMMQDSDDFINRQRDSINGGPPVSPFYDNQ